MEERGSDGWREVGGSAQAAWWPGLEKGVFLGDETHRNKNWDNVLEMVKGHLSKWKWLLPKNVLQRPDTDNKQPSLIYLVAPAGLCRSPTFSSGRGTTGFSRFLLGQDALDPTECPFPS